jgi:AraC-like DNA-binding protein
MEKKLGVYLNMFLSYLGILAIPILAGGVIYWLALGVTKSQTDKMNDNLLTMVQRELDYKVEEVIKVTNSVAMNSKVEELASVKGELSPENRLMMYYLYQDLSKNNLSEKFVDDIFVYFNRLRAVCSIKGNMSIEMYYDLYCDNSEYRIQEFEKYLDAPHFWDTLSLVRCNGENKLIFTMSDINSVMGGPRNFTAGVSMNLTALKKTMESMLWDKRMFLLIINSKNQVIAQTGEVPEKLSLDYDSLPAGNYVDRKLLDEPYSTFVRESENLEWKYVMLIPQSIIEKNARDIQKYAMVGLFACIFMGSAFSYYMTKKNYNPIRSLLDVFMGQGGRKPSKGENEYQWLRQQSEQFFKEHTDTRLLLADSQKSLRLYTLLKVLEYPYDMEHMKETLENYNIKVGLGFNAVIIFDVGQRKADADRELAGEYALRRFILKNIFEELVLDYFHIETVEIGERLAAVVGLPADGKEYQEKLIELVETLMQMTEDKFEFAVTALVGDIHEGLEGIHLSYMEACEIGEYIELLNTDLIVYCDVKNVQKKYRYSIDTEQRIINAIKTGHADVAKEAIGGAFDENIIDGISIDVCRCLIYDMMGTLLKGADEGGYHNFSSEFNFSKDLSARLPVGELKRRFGKLVDQICDKIESLQREEENDNKLSKKVQAYIQENYQDPDLNISMVGQSFGMTPAYLSTIYKKQTQESLLDYINKFRLAEAERLLREDHSVVEVAQMVGFRDSGSFIRVFKKKMGFTPGQLKKKN